MACVISSKSVTINTVSVLLTLFNQYCTGTFGELVRLGLENTKALSREGLGNNLKRMLSCDWPRNGRRKRERKILMKKKLWQH